MALTASQKAKLVQILGRNIIRIDLQLATWSEHITPEMETEVGTLITDWVALDGSFQTMEPNVRNFGVRYDPSSWRTQIIERLESLLFFESTSSTYSVQVVRQ